jgi:putative lipoprotein
MIGPRALLVTTVMALATGILGRPSPALAADDDPWFGADKAAHFGVSAALAAGTYGASAGLLELPRSTSLILGAGASAAAGIAKEGLDLAGFGDPSWKDLAWDGIGIVVGLALAWTVDILVRGTGPEGTAPAAHRAPDGGGTALSRSTIAF